MLVFLQVKFHLPGKSLMWHLFTKKEIPAYRPISLLSLVEKLQERLVHNVLIDHLLGTGAISPFKFGFYPDSLRDSGPGESLQHSRCDRYLGWIMCEWFSPSVNSWLPNWEITESGNTGIIFSLHNHAIWCPARLHSWSFVIDPHY